MTSAFIQLLHFQVRGHFIMYPTTLNVRNYSSIHDDTSYSEPFLATESSFAVRIRPNERQGYATCDANILLADDLATQDASGPFY